MDEDKVVIYDDNGVIADYTNVDDAMASFSSVPNEDVPSWTGDLVVAQVLAVRR